MHTTQTACCARCERTFTPRFRFQQVSVDGQVTYFCSQTCREPGLLGEQAVACARCGTFFTPSLVSHMSQQAQGRQYFCSQACRPLSAPHMPPAAAMPPTSIAHAAAAHPKTSPAHAATLDARRTRTLAVLNQKGGTAKTTTALSIAAGLAQLGHPTLLVDLDPQGNVGISLDACPPRNIYHVLIEKVPPERCASQVRHNLDIITADDKLALAETALARVDQHQRLYRVTDMMQSLKHYRYIIFDCAPAQSLLNQSALFYAGEVLIPVSCDYLALVGVKQVLKTLRRVTEQTGRAVRVAGVLPTFYDVRNRLSLESLTYLRQTFGLRALPPVRVNTKLAEAPSRKKTIFEYAPESHGARDYMRVVQWLLTGEGFTPPVNQAA